MIESGNTAMLIVCVRLKKKGPAVRSLGLILVLQHLLSAFSGGAHRHPKRPLPKAFEGVETVAHRGLHAKHPENSLAAFRAAADRGYAAECDVRLTKDRELVVFHDAALERMTDGTGPVAERSLAELQALHLKTSDGPTQESIPTLRQVLDTIDLGLFVELKQSQREDLGLEAAVVRLLREYESIHERVIIQSFNPFVLGRVAQLDPRLYRCQLFGMSLGHDVPHRHRVLLRRLMLNSVSKPDAVAGELCLLNEKRVRQLRKRFGYAVFAWTCKSAEDVRFAERIGADLTITDCTPES
jgi:glycerophosphoryl diester phosphodiesterase